MIVDAVANNGPVSICYDVAADFHFYKSGVYKRHAHNSVCNLCLTIYSHLFIVQNARMEVRMLIMLVS